ncbi:hypothetical protein [Bosea sp. 2RAB26]|uniref:hypothetical protein n=1 Tax=Bosea sp. 2RAB26 TaxID=3237476 RepID=UPI003F8DE710
MSAFPAEGSRVWKYEILIPIGGPGFLSRLDEIDAWLTEGDVAHQVKIIVGSGIVIRFTDEDFARAFAEAFALDPRKLRDVTQSTDACRCSPDVEDH